ncbi:MAG TPA: hypothetical protein VH598_01870 [Verrucomicrobiae bacterium]|nr:hypothetical protein [Verrucomicrobiae bacterium]
MSATGTRLAMLTQQLSQQWHDTKDYWRDAKCQEFERKYLEELIAGVDTAVTVMEQLDKLLAKIRKDCE